MPEVLLIDGPAAGQRVTVPPGSTGYHVRQQEELVITFAPEPDFDYRPPPTVFYRFCQAYDLDRNVIMVGWSDPGAPSKEALLRHLKQEQPVKVVAGALNWSWACDYAISQDKDGKTIQGVCACGWETETVPRRRTREVLALVDEHMEYGIREAQAYLFSKPREELTLQEMELLDLLTIVEEANRRG